ncbi:hypothetical protein KUCAC02_008507 [Chaenocephalus aceratus]|uniref:Uncharacterized protein n=1 Tax=Chaenocephalus aceratus TaxID=36190 RepID=A0ACB9X9W7_CHAAC|nr:hypothetical protein KUCAC02_008507 [Chaenocephalus aceratus]
MSPLVSPLTAKNSKSGPRPGSLVPQTTLCSSLKRTSSSSRATTRPWQSDLRGSVEALKQENSVLRVQLAKVREDAECREKSFTRQVQHLTEKLSSVLTMTSRETQTLPASVLGPPSLLSTQPNNTLAPPDTPTQPAAHSQLCPPQPPSTQPEEQDPQVVLLADSNGKFLDPRKLFPDKKVLSKPCSTTGQAVKLLKKETLRSPQYLTLRSATLTDSQVCSSHRLSGLLLSQTLRSAPLTDSQVCYSHRLSGLLLSQTLRSAPLTDSQVCYSHRLQVSTPPDSQVCLSHRLSGLLLSQTLRSATLTDSQVCSSHRLFRSATLTDSQVLLLSQDYPGLLLSQTLRSCYSPQTLRSANSHRLSGLLLSQTLRSATLTDSQVCYSHRL